MFIQFDSDEESALPIVKHGKISFVDLAGELGKLRILCDQNSVTKLTLVYVSY